MSEERMKTIDDLIDELGGMGKFQIFILMSIQSCQLFIGWSMLQMSFAGLVPDFNCLLGNETSLAFNINNNESLNQCDIHGTKCESYVYESGPYTVTEEWDLICDSKWIKSTVTSVQMAGVMVGALVASQCSDLFGRRLTLYFFVLEHIICNVIAAFSTSWVMFMVMRVFIGMGIGANVVVVYPYLVEFMPIFWRPLLSVIPTWGLGVSLFSAAALILQNWSHLHLAVAILSTPSLLGFFFVPESIRWLAVHGKIKEAECVLKRMARVNKKEFPDDVRVVLQSVINKERQIREHARKYTYVDLFRSWNSVRTSFVFFFFWFTLSTMYYGISFGVSSLSGNLYLNIFLLAVLEIPVQSTTFCFNNRVGRKWTTLGFFTLSGLSTLGCLLAQVLAGSNHVQGVAINVLCLSAKMFIGSVWSACQVWVSESYPTVTRNLGIGFSNMGARVGGIVAPFIINLDYEKEVSYSIMTGLVVICCLLVFTLKETKGLELQDSLPSKYDIEMQKPTLQNLDFNISSEMNEKKDTSQGLAIPKEKHNSSSDL